MADPQDNGQGQQPAPKQQPQPQARPDGVGQDWKLLEAPSGDQMWFSPDQANIAIQRGAKDITPEASQTARPEGQQPSGGILNSLKEGTENFGKAAAHGGLETLSSLDNTEFGKWLNGLVSSPEEVQKNQESFNSLLDKTETPKGSIGGALGKVAEQGGELALGGGALKALGGLKAVPFLGELGTNMLGMGALAGIDAKAHDENPKVSAAIGAGGELLEPISNMVAKTVPARIVASALRAGKSRFFGSDPAQELVDQGIVSPTTSGVVKKIGKHIAKSSGDVSKAINDAQNAGVKINASQAVTDPFLAEEQNLRNIHFDDQANKVTDYLQKLLDPYGVNTGAARAKLTALAPKEAQFLKDKVLQEIPKYGTASLRPGGEEANPISQASKLAARNLRASMEKAIPNISEGNRIMHNLIAAKEAIGEREAADAARGWRPSIPEMAIPAAVGGYTQSLPATLAAYAVTRAGESLPAALAAAQAIKGGAKLVANPVIRRGAEGAAANITRRK